MTDEQFAIISKLTCLSDAELSGIQSYVESLVNERWQYAQATLQIERHEFQRLAQQAAKDSLGGQREGV